VIIPVFNGTNYLSEAIESVLAQTFTNFEILIIDDGSTDSTWDIIQSFGEKVRGFHKENGGVASALNLGIKEMRGDWFAWLSHDDVWIPQKLERQIDFLTKHREFKACYSDYYEINSTGEIIRAVTTSWNQKNDAIWVLFYDVCIHGSSMIIHKTIFEKIGLFNEKLLFTQDGEMWIRILMNYEIGRVPEILIKGRIHPDQGSHKHEEHKKEMDSMYYAIFCLLLKNGFFPPNCINLSKHKKMSCAMKWLGVIMAYKRRRILFADFLFNKSIQYNPSLMNSAKLYKLINKIRCLLMKSCF
jgi:glycosyltransferase involved in cell wall biosynthesis